MTIVEKINLQELYEIDDHLWLEETIKLLKEKRLSELDLDNLIEELESLAQRDKLAMASLLQQVMIHLLLLNYWEREYERNCHHWQYEIANFRDQLNGRLTANLTKSVTEDFNKIYQKALKKVNIKTDYTLNLPTQCPYTLEQLLDDDWFPENKQGV
ncbi:MAG: DUF29 domain-containing protein [Cyanobacterium sp. T60_A2020_053]|nr:DUF29 domain-containing protein [Cyanobacterium sp. T60_A2020_053]